jgi:uncharacterized membrane protein YdjX (TVP38/TMEM64 family)
MAVIVVSVLLLMGALPVGRFRQALETWIEGLGMIGPTVFALVYAVATVLLLPGSVLTLTAGAIFGLWTGFITVTVGANVGAGVAFLIARYAARGKVEEMAAARPKFKAIDEAISEGGWKIVALLRLSPAIPFNAQNYLYGLTNIRFWTCVLTSFLAMIPGTFMYVYLGHIAGAAAVGDRQRTPGEWVLLIVGLVATIVVTKYITKLARKKLDERTARVKVVPVPESSPAEPPASVAGVLGYVLLAGCLLALAVIAQLRLRGS